MKIPFDIKYKPQIESGEYKVETRDAVPIRIICFDAPIRNYPIIGISDDPEGDPFTFTIDGRYIFEQANPDSLDLFIITPEPELTEFEQEVYKMTTNKVHFKEEANKLLALAKKSLFKQWNEDMKNEYARGKKDGITIGYNDAMKKYNESVSYHYSTYEPPCFHGEICTNPFKDCINCPRTGGDIGISTTTSGTCKKGD